MANHARDLKGITVGYLTAVEPTGSSTRYGVVWRVRCRCGNFLEMEASILMKKPRRGTGIPRSCGCYRASNRSHLYRGVGDLSSTFWKRVQKHAQRKGFVITIDITYAWGLFLKQRGLCALSGERLVLNPSSLARGANTASLDRIDSAKGYVAGNVQWVHKVVNDLKSNMVQEDFVLWCKRIADAQRMAYGAEFGMNSDTAKGRPSFAHLHDVAGHAY
jgi:hypothetical protein